MNKEKQIEDAFKLPNGATPDDCGRCLFLETEECNDCPAFPKNMRGAKSK
ncbi:MAG: hypothetical protein PHR77_12165 [Kiritimatiellae bacterium]|nr:hypothetical protein [Kiritimatiellia bacterium]MDD5519503.1 hypothetical protein [Kiritimatiellia bacterium]